MLFAFKSSKKHAIAEKNFKLPVFNEMEQKSDHMAAKPKARENAVTVNVGSRLRQAMDAAKNRASDDPLADRLKDADIVRDALRHWARESPYAMDAGEFALLLASRAMRKKETALWKGAMRGFAGLAGDADADVEGQINAFVESVADEEPRADEREDRGQVQPSRKRKAS